MADFTLYYWPVPFRGQFIRAILAHAGKTWDEADADAITALMETAPDRQPVPFMGPPVLVVPATGFALSEMPAIAFWLGETLGLLPADARGDAAGRAMTLKIVNDANDVLDEITLDGGREMWTPAKWKAYVPRLKRWMAIWEATGRRHGLAPDAGFLLGGGRPGVADLVTAILWGTMTDTFPGIGTMLEAEAPCTAALVHRLMTAPELAALAADSRQRYGGAYCGGQIEQSMRRVINGARG